jgi:hypothetical protein
MTTHKTSTHLSPAQAWKWLTLAQIIRLDGDYYVRTQIEKMISPVAKTGRLWQAESLSAAQVAKIRHPAGGKFAVMYNSKANRIAAD